MKTYEGSGDIAPLFITAALDEGVVSFTLRPLFPPGKEPPVPIGQEVGWVPKPIWTLWTREKSLASAGN
jgi:hypothetical protein